MSRSLYTDVAETEGILAFGIRFVFDFKRMNGTDGVTERFGKRRLKWYGHSTRMPKDGVEEDVPVRGGNGREGRAYVCEFVMSETDGV